MATHDEPSEQQQPTIQQAKHHPCLSRRTMAEMDGGDADWPALLQSWMDEYKPDSPSYEQHVQRAAQAELALRAEERRYDDANRKWLENDVTTWNPDLHKKERELSRRVDRAGIVAIRWSNLVERIRRSRLVDRAREEQARRKLPPPPRPNPLHSYVASNMPYVQIVMATVVDGVTTTTFKPPTFNVLMNMRNQGRPNHKVQRTLHLPQVLPPEYEWAKQSDGTHPNMLTWEMPEKEFIAFAEREKEAGDLHALPNPATDGNRETVLYPKAA